MSREPLKFLAIKRARNPQRPHRWPPSMSAEEIELAIDRLCGCEGRFDCDCVSVFGKARGDAWQAHNMAGRT